MADNYQTILVAVDFHDDNDAVVQKAVKEAELHGAKLQLVHVHEPMGMAYAADSISFGDQVYALEASIRRENKQAMEAMGNKLGLDASACHLLEGRPAAEIHQLAADNNVDLIVLGTHGQSGLQLLLGSTASAVLHGAACDVLAVRIKE